MVAAAIVQLQSLWQVFPSLGIATTVHVVVSVKVAVVVQDFFERMGAANAGRTLAFRTCRRRWHEFVAGDGAAGSSGQPLHGPFGFEDHHRRGRCCFRCDTFLGRRSTSWRMRGSTPERPSGHAGLIRIDYRRRVQAKVLQTLGSAEGFLEGVPSVELVPGFLAGGSGSHLGMTRSAGDEFLLIVLFCVFELVCVCFGKVSVKVFRTRQVQIGFRIVIFHVAQKAAAVNQLSSQLEGDLVLGGRRRRRWCLSLLLLLLLDHGAFRFDGINAVGDASSLAFLLLFSSSHEGSAAKANGSIRGATASRVVNQKRLGSLHGSIAASARHGVVCLVVVVLLLLLLCFVNGSELHLRFLASFCESGQTVTWLVDFTVHNLRGIYTRLLESEAHHRYDKILHKPQFKLAKNTSAPSVVA